MGSSLTKQERKYLDIEWQKFLDVQEVWKSECAQIEAEAKEWYQNRLKEINTDPKTIGRRLFLRRNAKIKYNNKMVESVRHERKLRKPAWKKYVKAAMSIYNGTYFIDNDIEELAGTVYDFDVDKWKITASGNWRRAESGNWPEWVDRIVVRLRPFPPQLRVFGFDEYEDLQMNLNGERFNLRATHLPRGLGHMYVFGSDQELRNRIPSIDW